MLRTMKKFLCLLLIVVTVAVIPMQAGALYPSYEYFQDQIVTTDEFFGYDAQGNILTPLPGVQCTCLGHDDGTQPYIPGDIVHDGSVNAADALYLLKSIA